jgi:hypothetical protein
VFEEDYLENTCGPIRVEGKWRIRTNKKETYQLIGHEDICVVSFFKSLRIRWLGHDERMNNNRMPNSIVISSQVLFHDGSLLLSKVQYTTVEYN